MKFPQLPHTRAMKPWKTQKEWEGAIVETAVPADFNGRGFRKVAASASMPELKDLKQTKDWVAGKVP